MLGCVSGRPLDLPGVAPYKPLARKPVDSKHLPRLLVILKCNKPAADVDATPKNERKGDVQSVVKFCFFYFEIGSLKEIKQHDIAYRSN